MAIGRTGLGTTSLGAVGGARGTAAGGLRILIEFLTQYDSSAVKELEKDLATLGAEETNAARRSSGAANGLANATRKRAVAEKELQKLISTNATKPAAARASLREIERVGVLSKLGQERLGVLDKEIGANGKLLTLATRIANAKKSQNRFTTQGLNAEKAQGIVAEQRLAEEQQLTRLQNIKSSVLPRLGGLAVGALGGIFGGAVIGVGFAAAQAVLDQVEQSLLDILDPARHARDAIKDVGDAVNSLAENGDRKGGAVDFLKQMGIAADDATVSLLAKVAADQSLVDVLEKLKEIQEIKQHPDAVEKKNIEEATKLLIEQARVRGDLKTVAAYGPKGTVRVPDTKFYASEAEKQLTGILRNQAAAAQEAAAAAANLELEHRREAAAAQLASFAEQQLVNAIHQGAQAKVDSFDSKIDAASEAGPSKRTLAIQAQIEKLNNAASGGSKNTELANIAQERALILLRQKLRLMGTAIDLEKYEGKFLLEAINAKLKALQKEAAAQDRLNKLLDLQYRASQVLRRNQGESISDFVERRAKENRDILSETRDLEREKIQESLQELQEKTQDEVALAELAERKKSAALQAGTDKRQKLLQKELAASQKADAAATKAKVAALQKQKKAYEDLRDTAEGYATDTKNFQIREAITAANSISKLQSLSGEISGLKAAQAFIQGLLQSGAVSGPEAKKLQEALTRISGTLTRYTNQLHTVITGHAPGKGPLEFAAGGLIPLNNASTPFGPNVRFGEEGQEYGLVLQHSVAKTLKNQRSTGPIGPFYVGESDNPLRQKYMLEEAVRQAVGKALG